MELDRPVNLVEDEYFTEQEVLAFLGIARITMAGRRSRGTDHPPYIEIGSVRLYPKREFSQWVKNRPVKWAVK